MLNELRSEFLVDIAGCVNITDSVEAKACIDESWSELLEEFEELKEIHAARLDLCGLLGGGAYDPVIQPSSFVQAIDHPLHPLPQGARWTYHRPTPEGLEVIDTVVLEDKETILGIDCTVVRVVETIGGQLEEVTLDYYAQDTAGNVWYFGEDSQTYGGEDPAQELAEIAGSWKSGVDGAKPGIVMHAVPVIGMTYRQEYLLNEAEDAATILTVEPMVTVPAGTFPGVLRVRDFSPLEPDENENKFYAPGVGLVSDLDVNTGVASELVKFSLP